MWASRSSSVAYYNHLLRSATMQWANSQFSDPTGDAIIIIIFVFRLLLIIVHTKARVRRYQQLNPSNMSYLVHLPSLVRAFSCLYSHTASMSSYSPPFLTPPPTSKCLHLETQSSAS